ncbi:MAG: 30S ribosomal protein S4 [Candidatus Aquicultor secundus]|uniref:Small ribosomal subunit protein uS4 n=1 Tax=Candidatus Aquicultor secundus TaxID=1973895 RepID=A0A2M7T9A8_9ACTN|nr:30S ribosomal protein S4 [Candidatus Aquicultor secundus]NCO65244.1 30S ribosomal protein S4 [Solirubrobacter sp.]OIO86233.1 MAG: 30S ribosomal protein S4 [Candidatus Aquicultor secundus]PIU26396.1 MAG: 30S ribosomal protein S4 [Candidatus Aquicultor secundus]PIW21426.1 MAG: 30S ribosomal protein S4 [Candidatus Aquicultor secundus]PIX53153.1 MAG: 30S ribosomal protein S4 [Candidatus Aquicultor secundus]
MARYTGPVCKLCRRETQKLFLKGDKCMTDKCPVERRPYPPGEHGRGRRKESEYYIQLREKQKAKRIYGVLEKQFRNYYELATKKKGVTGENLLQILESRLDNTIYRIGLAPSRTEARQEVRHGHVTVNGRKVDIPSFRVKPGDVITAVEGIARIKEAAESANKAAIPSWLEVDLANLSAKVTGVPSREDIDVPVQEKMIVELYSK